jgi:hypothetical protein
VSVYPQSCTKMTLNGFAQASSDAIKGWRTQYNLDTHDWGRYVLGGYDFWVDRAAASPKDHPEQKLTLEMVCGLLKSAMVCWKARLHDEEAVKVLEGGLTSINDDGPEPLVPPSAFVKKN